MWLHWLRPILEDERPSKSFPNLENAKRGYNEVMLIKKENPEYNPNLPDSNENARHIEVKKSRNKR